MNIKTIDINAREWFDRVNGNSYFSATIILNFGLKPKYSKPIKSHCNIIQLSETIINIPFQYGYGGHYIDIAGQKLNKQDYIKLEERQALWRYCEENNIILRTSKKENCLKRELLTK